MPESNDSESQNEFNFDQALDGLVKGVGAVLDVLAEALDNGAAGGRRPRPIDTHEPSIDIFDEGAEIMLVIELPGVHADDIQLAAQDDILDLETTGERHVAREILLPGMVDPATLRWEYRNRILEVRLERWGRDEPI